MILSEMSMFLTKFNDKYETVNDHDDKYEINTRFVALATFVPVLSISFKAWYII